MIPKTSEDITNSSVQDILQLANALDADILECPAKYRGHHAAVVVLCGPDTKAYLQALARTHSLLCEDRGL